MTRTMTRPTRWLLLTGLGVVSAWTLAACSGGAPDLTEISESAQQSMEEAESLTYTLSDPDGVHANDLSAMEFSGQTDQANFAIKANTTDMDMEILVVDQQSTFIRMTFTDEDMQAMFDAEGIEEGQWIKTPESEVADIEQFTDEFEGLSDRTFALTEGLTEEDLEAVEVEETELEDQAVYKYTVPATGETETELYPGADTVAFYFSQDSSELVQVEASAGESTATHTYGDYDSVEPIEAPPEDEIADLDWEF